jgi:type III secretory pathway component EscS
VWDPVATVGLLLIGLLDVTRTVAVARDLGSLLDAVFVQAGFGAFTSDDVAGAIGAVVIAVNVLGLIIAIALAVPRLRAHRTAFWIPLVAGVTCVVLTTGLLVGAAASDPAFTAQLQR